MPQAIIISCLKQLTASPTTVPIIISGSLSTNDPQRHMQHRSLKNPTSCRYPLSVKVIVTTPQASG